MIVKTTLFLEIQKHKVGVFGGKFITKGGKIVKINPPAHIK